MKELILAYQGEMTLKGLNRGKFEARLAKTIRWRLEPLGKFKVYQAQSTVFIEPKEEGLDMDEAFRRVSHVFGIVKLSRAVECPKDFAAICETAEAKSSFSATNSFNSALSMILLLDEPTAALDPIAEQEMYLKYADFTKGKIMGTNMKKVFTTLLCLLFCIAISAQDKAADLSKLVGDWSFSAPDAPYGYQDGSLQIKQENGKLTAKVNIQGSTLEINDIKAKGDTYTSSFYVDGTPVDLTMTQKGNKLEGMADAGGMQIPVKFKKTKK